MMKQILIAAACLITMNVMGQNETRPDLKPESGVTLDVDFNPFSGNPVSLKFMNARYFMSPDLALRLGFGLDYNQNKYDNLLAGNNMYIEKSSTFLFALRPGVEQHFVGTERLSPFIGAEIIFEMFQANAKIEDGSNNYIVE